MRAEDIGEAKQALAKAERLAWEVETLKWAMVAARSGVLLRVQVVGLSGELVQLGTDSHPDQIADCPRTVFESAVMTILSDELENRMKALAEIDLAKAVAEPVQPA